RDGTSPSAESIWTFRADAPDYRLVALDAILAGRASADAAPAGAEHRFGKGRAGAPPHGAMRRGAVRHARTALCPPAGKSSTQPLRKGFPYGTNTATVPYVYTT
ncbi:MAG TPA: hypothetical protein VN520_22780, partial [Streptomyces sp.]|nr:hypothetical protein [Streptomyces sp.]